FDNSLENRGLKNSFIEPGPGWSQVSMAPSRMFKAFTSEGGIKTPMLVKLPGKMAHADTLNHSFFHVRDIMPTILDLVKIVSPEKFKNRDVRSMQGKSVLDLFAGKSESPYAEANQVGYELFGMKAFFIRRRVENLVDAATLWQRGMGVVQSGKRSCRNQ
ncbi:MAG: hypothetical protein JRE27_12435, partial [Deltaproteobacteria bacterium]|nr:hypothetical protein [Deltaproteobacteria bacterium]